MPQEVIYCTAVGRAAAAPPEAGTLDRPEIWEPKELRDVILAETCCGTALWDEPPEPLRQHWVNLDLGRSCGAEGMAICC